MDSTKLTVNGFFFFTFFTSVVFDFLDFGRSSGAAAPVGGRGLQAQAS